ncbi:MAG: HDIG domain-containing protein [Burkholderiales bacterium]|nr:HDIG domain-containing protein [Anaerolineae bacterium]
MKEWLSERLVRYLRFSDEQAARWLHLVGVTLAALSFLLMATLVVAFDDIAGRAGATLQIGNITEQNIRAPISLTYVSQVLTDQRRQAASDSVRPVFDPPDPNVARQQSQLARQILDFIDNVRRDPYATLEQKITDINKITALTLDEAIVPHILEMDDETWRSVDDQIVNVLERVMRESIRDTDMGTVLSQLPMQVSVRFNADDVSTIVSIVGDLVRPNTFANPQETEAMQLEASNNTPSESRSFERGQIVVREGTRIDGADYEALNQLGLLRPAERRLQGIARAFLAVLIVMITAGLYIARFTPELYEHSRFLALLAFIFLLALIGARLFGVGGQIYVYPAAALALLYVTVMGAEIAVIGTLGLALLMGLMANNSLEIAALVSVGGIIGALSLRRSERLNSYFFAGLVISLANTLVVTIFNLGALAASEETSITVLILYSLLNGILAAAASLVGMYIVTLLFNLPTSLKLVELSQPNQPLLQRLLREAPGTYQHSLQVANLSEQAANAIGANAELVRVSALYHDIGKMLNPAFFVENQADAVNPHDVLNDPYRSADIIISHVTDGDKLARQYRLPARVRDFIMEHHGTTRVAYFYQKAVDQAGSDAEVDVEQFTYPGPTPQSRETGLMMLADSCESTVRARRPTNRQEIFDIVQEIFDARTRDGQLDSSGLTTSDIKTIRNIFVEMLQAVFHPRINYPAGATQALPKTGSLAVTPKTPLTQDASSDALAAVNRAKAAVVQEASRPRRTEDKREDIPVTSPSTDTGTRRAVANGEALRLLPAEEDDSPLPDVPPLPRTGEFRAVRTETNGVVDGAADVEKPAGTVAGAGLDTAADKAEIEDTQKDGKPDGSR